MTHCYRQRTVPHSVDKVYTMINDITSYQQFVPRCVGSEVLEQSEEHMVGKLTFDVGFTQLAFTSRNTLDAPKSIRMELVDGPFRHFGGEWRFEAQDDGQTLVTMDFDFSLSRGLSLMLEPLFAQVIDRLVDCFCRRADEIYRD